MVIRVHAKINLALNILEVEHNMHVIDTIMCNVSLFDELTIIKSNEIKVTCDTQIDGINIATRAAELVKEITGECLSVHIKKGIPIGGGLGGSSADGAGVLWAANKLFGMSLMCDMEQVALSLGADVPYMLVGGMCRCGGYGEKLSPIEGVVGELLIVECGSVSTAEAYRLVDNMAVPSCNMKKVAKGLVNGDYVHASNALLRPAMKLNPRLFAANDMLHAARLNPKLSGSGGCLFAEYDAVVHHLMQAKGYVCHKASMVKQNIEIIEK